MMREHAKRTRPSVPVRAETKETPETPDTGTEKGGLNNAGKEKKMDGVTIRDAMLLRKAAKTLSKEMPPNRRPDKMPF